MLSMIIIFAKSIRYFTSLQYTHNHPLRKAQLSLFSDEEIRGSENRKNYFSKETQRERSVIKISVQMGIKMSPGMWGLTSFPNKEE